MSVPRRCKVLALVEAETQVWLNNPVDAAHQAIHEVGAQFAYGIGYVEVRWTEYDDEDGSASEKGMRYKFADGRLLPGGEALT